MWIKKLDFDFCKKSTVAKKCQIQEKNKKYGHYLKKVIL